MGIKKGYINRIQSIEKATEDINQTINYIKPGYSRYVATHMRTKKQYLLCMCTE